MLQLIDLKSIRPICGQELINEAFYRSFDNRRQIRQLFALTGTPALRQRQRPPRAGHQQAGNRRARTLAIELAWLWLRRQPGSELSQWFRQRVGDAKGRLRRIAVWRWHAS